jgi:uncharacterized protein YxeA
MKKNILTIIFVIAVVIFAYYFISNPEIKDSSVDQSERPMEENISYETEVDGPNGFAKE